MKEACEMSCGRFSVFRHFVVSRSHIKILNSLADREYGGCWRQGGECDKPFLLLVFFYFIEFFFMIFRNWFCHHIFSPNDQTKCWLRSSSFLFQFFFIFAESKVIKRTNEWYSLHSNPFYWILLTYLYERKIWNLISMRSGS